MSGHGLETTGYGTARDRRAGHSFDQADSIGIEFDEVMHPRVFRPIDEIGNARGFLMTGHGDTSNDDRTGIISRVVESYCSQQMNWTGVAACFATN